MTSNYKLSGNAYSNIRENFDMTHDHAHKFANAIEKNYQNGGGFGYICIPKPQTTDNQGSNFEQSTDVECRYAFIGPNLIGRRGDDASVQAFNAKEFNEEQYFVLNGSEVVGEATSEDSINNLAAAKSNTNTNGLGLE